MQSQLAAPPAHAAAVATHERLGPIIVTSSTQLSPAAHSLHSATWRALGSAAGVVGLAVVS